MATASGQQPRLSQGLLAEEVYAIPLGARTLHYAPLTRRFLVTEGAPSTAVDRWRREAIDGRRVPGFVRRRGFSLGEGKLRLRLNVTTRCNLACSYCSVQAGSASRDMPEAVARQAVLGFSRLALDRNLQDLEVVFSGGEPTLKLQEIDRTIRLTRHALAGTRIAPSFRILTNGLFEREAFAAIVPQLGEVQVSWDGIQRSSPRYGRAVALGQSVKQNLRFLIDRGVQTSVLTVVSRFNQHQLRTIVEELYGLGVRHLFLAIQENLGRTRETATGIDFAALEEEYFSTWDTYRRLGMEVNLTGTDIHSISPFPCSLPVPNYSVGPDGVVSACTIAFNDSGALSQRYEIGRITENGLSLDEVAIGRMRGYHVLNMPGCRACHAKWHCRGGCIYAKGEDWFAPLSAERCALARNLVARKLFALAIDGPRLCRSARIVSRVQHQGSTSSPVRLGGQDRGARR